MGQRRVKNSLVKFVPKSVKYFDIKHASTEIDILLDKYINIILSFSRYNCRRKNLSQSSH